MKPWKVLAFSLLITITIGGIYLFVVFKHRQDPGVAGQQVEQRIPEDDLAEVRAIMPTEFKDVEKLQGTTVWMKNGYTIPYFAYSGGRVQFSQRIGLIPAAQRMEVKRVIKSAVPASVDDGMSHGSRQALAVFALPSSPGLYATPIGVMDGASEAYFTDLLFYYDDPHTIYNYWPKDVWAAIDAHQVKPGMSELETRLAVGQKLHAEGGKEGNRTVTYDQGGKQWTVTFVDNHATKIKAG